MQDKHRTIATPFDARAAGTGAYVVEGLGVLDAVFLTEFAVAAEDELFDVAAISGRVLS